MSPRSVALAAAFALVAAGTARAGWFANPEREAFDQFQAGDYAAAAARFADPYHRGVALYRAGRYGDAAQSFAQAASDGQRGEDQDARYNLGNCRFQLGDYAGAAAAYEQVLSARPADDDAAHNLALARARLARLEQDAYTRHLEERDRGQVAETRRDPPTVPPQRRSERPGAQADQQEARQAPVHDQAKPQGKQEPPPVQQQKDPRDQKVQEGRKAQEDRQDQQQAQTEQGRQAGDAKPKDSTEQGQEQQKGQQQQGGQPQKDQQGQDDQQGQQDQRGQQGQQGQQDQKGQSASGGQAQGSAGQSGQGDGQGNAQAAGQAPGGKAGAQTGPRPGAGQAGPGQVKDGASAAPQDRAPGDRKAGAEERGQAGDKPRGEGRSDLSTPAGATAGRASATEPRVGSQPAKDAQSQPAGDRPGQPPRPDAGGTGPGEGARDAPTPDDSPRQARDAAGKGSDGPGRDQPTGADPAPPRDHGGTQDAPEGTGEGAAGGRARGPGGSQAKTKVEGLSQPRPPVSAARSLAAPREESGTAGPTEVGAGRPPPDARARDREGEHQAPGGGRPQGGRSAVPRPGLAAVTGRDQAPAAGPAEAIERFDQQGQGPLTEPPPDARPGATPTLGGPAAMGVGMAILEQRLRQVEGDPSLLIGNQFKLEEQRALRGADGPVRETRPW